MKKFFAAIFFVATSLAFHAKSQTTINTTIGSTGYTAGNGVPNNAAITFVVENASGSDILLDDVGDYFQVASNGATVTLWYTSTLLSDTSTIQTPGWSSIATGTIAVAADGIVPCFTALGFLIPNGAQYRFAIQSSASIRYSGTGAGACTPSVFTDNGISLKCGEATINTKNVGYGGVFPKPPNSPRWFTGYVIFNPAGPCTSPPVPGTVTSTQNPVCASSNFALALTGGTTGTGQAYQWESSPDNVTWTPITGANSASLQTSQTVSTYYRAQVTCGTSTVVSAGLQVLSPALFPGGTYTINPAGSGTSNFLTFADAINAIKCGIAGPIVFNVVANSGPYAEQVVIPAIGNTSATNTITFNGNANNIVFPSADVNAKAVVKLDGADYVTFKDFNLEATGGTYGWGVHLTNNADHDSIVNCIFTTDGTSTSTNHSGIVISGSNTSPTATGASATNAVIMGNTVNNGYYGITNAGAIATPFNSNNQFINNTILDCYNTGIYSVNSSDIFIANNVIKRPTRTTTAVFYGIYLGTNTSNAKVEKNKVTNLFDALPSSTSAAYGVYISGDGTSGAENKIYNNLISDFGHTGTAYGIYNVGAAFMKAYHNTISFDNTGAPTGATYGFYQTVSDTAIEFKNNIVTITLGGTGIKYGIYKNAAVTPLVSNYNSVYVNSTGTGAQGYGFQGVPLATLADWQTATAQDMNSVSIDPVYTALGSDYTPTAVSLNDRGTPLGITTDINNAPRSLTNPDVGAYEFSVGNCTSPPTPGDANTLTPEVCANASLTLRLLNNSAGTGQTYQWESATTTAGPWTPVGTSINNPDTTIIATNNLCYRAAVTCGASTAYSTPVCITVNQPISGNYTINSAIATSGTNFQSFTEAVNKLKCGVGGSVVFNVVTGSGPYTEQISIPALSGTSAINTVTFKGNGETLQFAPTTAARHIIVLNGADYVTFDSLTIKTTDPTYGYGIHLLNAADNNTIVNCTIDMSAVTSTTAANSSCITASNSTTSTTTAGNNANNLTISKNILTGGYYAVSLYGDATNGNSGNKVMNNVIQDFYSGGLYTAYNISAIFSNNDIHRTNRTDVGTFYGVYLGTLSKACLIGANRIHDSHTAAATQTGAAYGIYMTGADGTPGMENLVVNNAIYNFNSGSGTIYGVYSTGSDSCFYYHNTITLDNSGSTTGLAYGIYQTGTANGIRIKNNIINIIRAGTGNKYAVYFATVANIIESNHNDLYVNSSGGTNGVGYFGTGYITLADWKTANSGAYDQQSVSVDPLFVSASTGDLTPAEPAVNDIGENLSIPVDILGNPRSATSPDPGAFEFSLGGCVNPPTAGTANSSLTFVCSGENFTLDLSGNSTGAGQTYQWQSSPDNSTWTNIGTAQTVTTYTASQTVTTYYRAGVTCSAGTTVYSTSVMISSPISVSGTFTINSALPTGGTNFQTFAEAISLIKCGINGPVVFNVASGSSYTEQVIIPDIQGTSAINTITFNGNGAAIAYTSTTSSERAVIKLKGTDYVTIDSLSITATGSAVGEYGYGIQLVDDADYNTISHCVINTTTTPATATSTSFAGIVINAALASSPLATGDSKCDSNTVVGNTIIGGYCGVSIVANGVTNVVNGNRVSNNTIQDFYIYGVNTNGNINSLISGNDVSRPSRTSNGTFYGIYVGTGDVGTLVSKNKVHDPFAGDIANTSSAYAIYAGASDGVPGSENVISNNMIYGFNSAGSQYGLYNTGSDYTLYYYNSILLDGPANTSTTYVTRGLYQSAAATGIEYKNNIVYISRASLGENTCIYMAATTTTYVSDYNDLYMATTSGTSNNTGYTNATAYATLASWSTATTKDVSSISADPLFLSSTDLHISTGSPCENAGITLASVTTDIDGELRPPLSPDMGADEIGILPVVLRSISASLIRKDAVVNWSIASAVNLHHFEVERSLSGNSFEKAGTVQYQATTAAYRFTDYEMAAKVPANTVIYYRIKMTDKDGKFAYTPVVSVKTGNSNHVVMVYPNPFVKELFVKLTTEKNENVSLKLTDKAGRLMALSNQTITAGTSIINMPVADKIAAGMYILTVEMKGEHYNFKVVK